MSYTNISNLGTTQSEILKGLDFYKDEIRLMEIRLVEVAAKNNQFEARQGIEHFESQFLIQRNNIGQLRHRINEYNHEAASDAAMHQGRIKKELLSRQEILQQEYKAIEKVISELTHEFRRFLSKWM
jgi:septation ring formation regulator EzrA